MDFGGTDHCFKFRANRLVHNSINTFLPISLIGLRAEFGVPTLIYYHIANSAFFPSSRATGRPDTVFVWWYSTFLPLPGDVIELGLRLGDRVRYETEIWFQTNLVGTISVSCHPRGNSWVRVGPTNGASNVSNDMRMFVRDYLIRKLTDISGGCQAADYSNHQTLLLFRSPDLASLLLGAAIAKPPPSPFIKTR